MKRDLRTLKRLDVELDLTWAIESQNLTGSGKLLDVSVHGACFRMDQPFGAKSNLVFTLDAPDVPDMPRRGRLRWYRKLPGRVPVFLCGIVFDDHENEAWIRWLDRALASPTEQTA